MNLSLQIQKYGLRYRKVGLVSGKLQTVCVDNKWFEPYLEVWTHCQVDPAGSESSEDADGDSELVRLFSQHVDVLSFASDQVFAGLDPSVCFLPHLPFGALHILVIDDGKNGIVSKIRLNQAMLPPITDIDSIGFNFDVNSGLATFQYDSVNGSVGCLLYRLVPVLFMSQLASQCMPDCGCLTL